MKVYALNTPIITAEGLFRYRKAGRAQCFSLISTAQEGGVFTSAIGHPATAEVLSNLLGVEIPHNRAPITMAKGDCAVVFKLKKRLPEGVVLKTRQEIEEAGYELGILEMLDDSPIPF